MSEQEKDRKNLEESSDSQVQPKEIQICLICREHNLTESTQFNNCVKCNQVYCLHFASSIDPAYCTECLHDVKVVEEIIIKKQEHYNAETDKVYTRTRKAKKITISGMHWLFQARKIKSLTDLELSLAIEYHQDILTQMLYEREERRVQYAHRNAGKKLSVNFNTSGTVTETTTENITVKKTRIKTATKADPQEQLLAALKTLQNLGLSASAISKMASVTGGKK